MPNQNDILTKYILFFKDLKRYPDLDIINSDFQINEENSILDSKKELEIFEDKFKVKIENKFKILFLFPMITELIWHNSTYNIGGEIFIFNFYDVFRENMLNQHSVFPIYKSKKSIKGSSLRYFDHNPYKGNNYHVVFSISETDNPFNQIFVLYKNRLIKLNINIFEYFEYNLIAKGFYYWQLIFSSNPLSKIDFGEEINIIENSFKKIEAIFKNPDVKKLEIIFKKNIL